MISTTDTLSQSTHEHCLFAYLLINSADTQWTNLSQVTTRWHSTLVMLRYHFFDFNTISNRYYIDEISRYQYNELINRLIPNETKSFVTVITV